LDTSGFDLAIPLSSLKGNKPALGNHQGKILMGLVCFVTASLHRQTD